MEIVFIICLIAFIVALVVTSAFIWKHIDQVSDQTDKIIERVDNSDARLSEFLDGYVSLIENLEGWYKGQMADGAIFATKELDAFLSELDRYKTGLDSFLKLEIYSTDENIRKLFAMTMYINEVVAEYHSRFKEFSQEIRNNEEK